MIYCKVENGVVVNRAVFDTTMPTDWPEYDAYVQNDEAQIDWLYANGVFTAPEPPVVEPQPPSPPSPEVVVLLNHENRLRSQEGTPPLTLEDFRQQFEV